MSIVKIAIHTNGRKTASITTYEEGLMKAVKGAVLEDTGNGKLFKITMSIPLEYQNYALSVLASACHYGSNTEVAQPASEVGKGISDVGAYYYALKLFRHIDVDPELTEMFLPDISVHPDYIAMLHPEYFWFLYKLDPTRVNWPKIFLTHIEPMKIIETLSNMSYFDTHCEEKIEMTNFFFNMNYASMAENGLPETNRRIELLEFERRKMWKSFLIDPHTMLGYFKYQPSTATNVISSVGISRVSKPEPGTPMMIDYPDAIKALDTFTMGVFKKSRNPKFTGIFPFDNVVIAGGCIERILKGRSVGQNNPSDVDLFVVGKGESRTKAFKTLLDFFDIPPTDGRPNVYFVVKNNSVIEVRIVGIERVFQIILQTSVYPIDIISRFDMTHVSCCYYNGKFYMTPSAATAHRTMTTEFNNLKRARGERFAKAIQTGYDLDFNSAKTDIAEDIIKQLADAGSDLHKQAKLKQFSFHTLNHISDMSPEEETLKNTYDLSRHVGPTYSIYNDTNAVFKVAVVDGNFDTDYVCPNVVNFTNDMIANNGYIGGENGVIVKAFNNKPLTLLTEVRVAALAQVLDKGIDLPIVVTPELEDFQKKLDNIYVKFNGRNINNARVEKADMSKIHFPEDILNRHTTPRRGTTKLPKPVCRDLVGGYVNMEESVDSTTTAKLLFNLKVIVHNQTKRVVIIPKAFITTNSLRENSQRAQVGHVKKELVIKPTYADL